MFRMDGRMHGLMDAQLRLETNITRQVLRSWGHKMLTVGGF